jgi:hypothetical protein
MNQHCGDISLQEHRPRVRELPRCEACLEVMIAPEVSALGPDGNVSYLWSCEGCGKSVITNFANGIPS